VEIVDFTSGEINAMSPSVFISYRRKQSLNFAGRLADHLRDGLQPHARVFRDIEDMRVGEPFPIRLRDEIRHAAVVLVVIGPQWLSETTKRAAENDWVRIEVETALRLRRYILPVLVGRTRMPKADRLPESIQPITSLNAFRVRDDVGFAEDVARLAIAIRSLTASCPVSLMAPADPVRDFGTAIIDCLTLGWIASCLEDCPEPLNFFDVAAFIEGVVFHDCVRVLLPAQPDGEHEQTFVTTVEEVCGPLVRGGIVALDRIEDPQPSSARASHQLGGLRRKRRKNKTVIDASEDFTAWMLHTISTFAFSERFHRGDAIVFPCQAPIYKLNARVRLEHSLCNLYRNYETVRELAQVARMSSSGAVEFGKLPLPPVFLDAMKRAVTLSSIWNSIGDLWEAHTALRARCRELRLILSDPDVVPAKREVEARKWRREWSALTRKWHDRVQTFSTADTTEELCRVRGLLRFMTPSADDQNRGARMEVIENLLECCDGFVKLREIHDSLEAYWNLSDRELYRQAERLLKRSITSKDHDDIVRAEQEDRRQAQSGVVIVDFFTD
jgi:TIR domain